MKKLFWLCGGYPQTEQCSAIADAYMAGGCDGVEWAIPPKNPYREQAHLLPYYRLARDNAPDALQHLHMMVQFRKQYPQAEVFPAIYQETVSEVGVDKLVALCLQCGIDTLFLIGTYDTSTLLALSVRMKIATSVSYYMLSEELEKARADTGFIYLQALPYAPELEAGYTPARLKECIAILRSSGIDRPIYCAKGIKSPEHAAFVGASGADGYILGSAMVAYYGDLRALTEAVLAYPKG